MKATAAVSSISVIPVASSVRPVRIAISSHSVPVKILFNRNNSIAVRRNQSEPARIVAVSNQRVLYLLLRPFILRLASLYIILQMVSSATEPAPSGRHAFLHDFCMCIPYGIIVAAGGLLSAVWFGLPGLYIAAAGIAEVVLSTRSLKAWRRRQSSTIYTLLQAAIASGVAYAAYNSVRQGTAKWASTSLLGLSACASLFFLYNVAAGGNPPKEFSKDEGGKAEEEVEQSEEKED